MESSQWLEVGGQCAAKLKLVRFGNCTLVFLFFQGKQRIATYVSAKLQVDSISASADFGAGDVEVKVHFGDREDVFSQVIARRLIELLHTDVILAVSSKSPQTQHECLEVVQALQSLLAS
ncbi:hypothetical protein BASA81_007081 [Batrachochytrium salamandrivorans]|nr:hypothetical protein BASA81_007081 [Batrachochytrium salamandrivorans]